MHGAILFLCMELYYSYGGRNSIAMKVGMGGSPLSDATRGNKKAPTPKSESLLYFPSRGRGFFTIFV